MSNNLINKTLYKLATYFGAESVMQAWLCNDCKFETDASGVFRKEDLILDLAVSDGMKMVALYSKEYRPIFILNSYADGRITTRGSSPIGW